MLERQREGIAKAKREGRYKGHVPTARSEADEIIRLKEVGVRPSEIAIRLGIGRAERLSGAWRTAGSRSADGGMMSINTLMPRRLICSAHRMANMHFAVALWPAVSASFPQPLRHDPHLRLDCGSSVQA